MSAVANGARQKLAVVTPECQRRAEVGRPGRRVKALAREKAFGKAAPAWP
jgi:hypothetical protein